MFCLNTKPNSTFTPKKRSFNDIFCINFYSNFDRKTKSIEATL